MKGLCLFVVMLMFGEIRSEHKKKIEHTKKIKSSEDDPFIMKCRNGDTFAAIYPDLVNFDCKPGPAHRKDVHCEEIVRLDYSQPGWRCPNYGYISGFDVLPSRYIATCCTAPGLYYTDDDCVEYENTENANGQVYRFDPDKAFVSGRTVNGGQTFLNIECRYRKYTNPKYRNYFHKRRYHAYNYYNPYYQGK